MVDHDARLMAFAALLFALGLAIAVHLRVGDLDDRVDRLSTTTVVAP